MKRIFKYFFLRILYFLYNLLVKLVIKDKITFPKKYVYNLYEIFPSLDHGYLKRKIAVPYVDVNYFNRHDLDRPYEVLNIDLIGKKESKKEITLSPTKNFILPVSLLDESGEDKSTIPIHIGYGKKNKSIQLKFKNRFHYIPIKSNLTVNKISVKSDYKFIAVGSPFYLDRNFFEKTSNKKKSKPKLIIHILVDALAKVIIDDSKSEIMPATKSFFSSGIIFENAFSQSDWTLSSMSGVFTGKYTKDHLIYHPRKDDKIKSTTLAQVLSDEGYLTSLISAVPRLTPLNGFDKGFTRCLIAPHKDANYIINEAIEQIDAFGGNQYIFIGLFDIHEAYQLQPLSAQVNNKINDFNYKKINSSKILSTLIDKERSSMYVNSLKHLDRKLKRLFKKINKYDKDATVLLHSDHGVDFITQNTQRLSKEREKVALMIKGRNLPKNNNKDVIEIRKIPELIFNASNIKINMDISKCDFVMTESIYPNQEYELAVRDNKYVLFFQVPWKFIKNRTQSGYEFKASLHNVQNELEALENNIIYNLMLDAAKKHYSGLIINLIKNEVYYNPQ